MRLCFISNYIMVRFSTIASDFRIVKTTILST